MVVDTAIKPKDKVLKPKDETPKVEEPPLKVNEPPPKTYTQKELDEEKERAVHDALMKAGRDWKKAETERDSIASQLKEIQSANAKLASQVDELSNADPDKFNVVKRNRELDDLDQKIKQERQSLEADKQSHQERIKLADKTLREIAIFDVAERFEGGDAEKLKVLVDTFNTKNEDISKIAETLWKLKEKEPEELKLDSSITTGGLSEETIRKNYREHPDDPKAKAEYLAWRRKKGI